MAGSESAVTANARARANAGAGQADAGGGESTGHGIFWDDRSDGGGDEGTGGEDGVQCQWAEVVEGVIWDGAFLWKYGVRKHVCDMHL